MRPALDVYFLKIARVVATRATCLRRAVGCVLVDKRGHVLSTGYNGRAAGLSHCNEATGFRTQLLAGQDASKAEVFGHACVGATAASGTDLDNCEAIHAEQNALLQCHDVYAIATGYVTCAPCVTCVKLLLNTSCDKIVFDDSYPQAAAALALWEDAGRTWLQLHD